MFSVYWTVKITWTSHVHVTEFQSTNCSECHFNYLGGKKRGNPYSLNTITIFQCFSISYAITLVVHNHYFLFKSDQREKKWNVWVYPILSSEMLVHKIFVSVTLRYMGIALLHNVIKLSFSLQIAEKDLKNTSTKTVAIQSIYTGMCWGAEVLNATPMYTEPGVAGPIFVPT